MQSLLTYRAIAAGDRPWLIRFLQEHWGDTTMVSRGRVFQADKLPGFVALMEHERVGVVLFDITGGECEIALLQSLVEQHGIGSKLIAMVSTIAQANACRRLWLITTNDNIHALRFYQKRGMRFVALYRDAVTAARKLKPSIPLIGSQGIPVRDEIELEMQW